MPPRRHRRLSLSLAQTPTPFRPRPKSWASRAPRPAPPSCLAPPAPPSPRYLPVRVRDFVTVAPARHAPPSLALGPVDSAARPPSYDLALVSRRLSRAAAATQTAPDWDPAAVDRLLDRDDALYDDLPTQQPQQQQPPPPVKDLPHPAAGTQPHPENTPAAYPTPDPALAPTVFLIEDVSHLDRLRHIVGLPPHRAPPAAAPFIDPASPTPASPSCSPSSSSSSSSSCPSSSIASPPSAASSASLDRRHSLSSTADHHSESPASSRAASETSALSTTSSCALTVATPSSSLGGGSGSGSSGNAGGGAGGGGSPSGTSSTSLGSSSEKSARSVTSEGYTPSRRRLINSARISPVKYTFRPPVPVPDAAQPEGIRSRDRDEAAGAAQVGAGPAAWPYRHRRQSTGTMPNAGSGGPFAAAAAAQSLQAQFGGEAVGSSPSVPISPPLLAKSLFRKAGKRESNESAKSSAASTSTEYYEDEYTKFIEKKTGSPLRIPGKPYLAKMIGNESWTGKGQRLDCNRSNSTVSVATSDDEYDPSHESLSNV